MHLLYEGDIMSSCLRSHVGGELKRNNQYTCVVISTLWHPNLVLANLGHDNVRAGMPRPERPTFPTGAVKIN